MAVLGTMGSVASYLSSIVIRAGRVEETAEIIDLVIRAFGTTRPLFTDATWSELTANIRSGLSGSNGTFNQTAWSAAVLVGSVAYSGPTAPRNGFPPGWSYIRALGVETTCSGRGVGRLLVQSCIEQAWRDHAPAIGLYTADTNVAASHLYKSLGFVASPEPMTKYGIAYHRHAFMM